MFEMHLLRAHNGIMRNRAWHTFEIVLILAVSRPQMALDFLFWGENPDLVAGPLQATEPAHRQPFTAGIAHLATFHSSSHQIPLHAQPCIFSLSS